MNGKKFRIKTKTYEFLLISKWKHFFNFATVKTLKIFSNDKHNYLQRVPYNYRHDVMLFLNGPANEF